MTTEESIIETFRQLFEDYERPVDFTNRHHCSECAEYNDLLHSLDRYEMDSEELEETWTPLCFSNTEGFLYLMPGLVRLVVDFSEGGYDLGNFLFHLNHDRMKAMSSEQLEAIHDLLCYIRLRHRVTVRDNLDLDDLNQRIQLTETLLKHKGS